jgi:hypothetical protein
VNRKPRQICRRCGKVSFSPGREMVCCGRHWLHWACYLDSGHRLALCGAGASKAALTEGSMAEGLGLILGVAFAIMTIPAHTEDLLRRALIGQETIRAPDKRAHKEARLYAIPPRHANPGAGSSGITNDSGRTPGPDPRMQADYPGRPPAIEVQPKQPYMPAPGQPYGLIARYTPWRAGLNKGARAPDYRLGQVGPEAGARARVCQRPY